MFIVSTLLSCHIFKGHSDLEEPVTYILPYVDPAEDFDDIDLYIYQVDTDIELLCLAEGNPKPNVFWKKDGNNIQMDFNQTLTLNRLGYIDSGEYTCQAENQNGSIIKQSSFYIGIDGPCQVDIRLRYCQ